MIRIFLMADSPIVRVGLETILQAEPELTVVGGTADSQPLNPPAADVILVATELSEDRLGQLGPLLDAESSTVEVVWLVTAASEAWITEALRSGILGLLPNDATAAEIVVAIQAVAAGLVVLHPDLARLLTSPTLRPAPAAQGLSQREIEVLQMLAEGMANKTIARQLQLSEHTVKFHISSIFSKLNVSSRTEAVMLGLRQGLIML
jgi:two-component system, NarL family, response regulator YdfI